MGTNYYLIAKKDMDMFTILHIGKSSAGWKFTWQGYTSTNLCNKEQWLSFLKMIENIDVFAVQNEYGENKTVTQFLEYLDVRENNHNNKSQSEGDIMFEVFT